MLVWFSSDGQITPNLFKLQSIYFVRLVTPIERWCVFLLTGSWSFVFVFDIFGPQGSPHFGPQRTKKTPHSLTNWQRLLLIEHIHERLGPFSKNVVSEIDQFLHLGNLVFPTYCRYWLIRSVFDTSPLRVLDHIACCFWRWVAWKMVYKSTFRRVSFDFALLLSWCHFLLPGRQSCRVGTRFCGTFTCLLRKRHFPSFCFCGHRQQQSFPLVGGSEKKTWKIKIKRFIDVPPASPPPHRHARPFMIPTFFVCFFFCPSQILSSPFLSLSLFSRITQIRGH